ncbi:MAG: hypothetical protein JOZ68_04070 [Acidimicrobiia bacterium]|nr:hypothetical protein [Acidimicrobiia bacterium]MBV9040152.1 hypothetical protein [Acidimicrobiia bacterium]
MARYDDVLDVLKVVRDHESIRDPDKACNPCETIALAKAMDLEPQEVADLLSDAERRGRMITAKKAKGETEPYFSNVRLTPNGRAAVARHSRD